MELKAAVALVTGGSEGIGRGIAEALKAEGSVVTITGRRENVLRDAAEQIGVECVAGDVGSEPDAVRTVAAVIEKHGRLDILVNNAGYGVSKPLIEMETL
jgi:NAD(P)-dependent dehydrogenase (short-subunit alcohol dehydrogenase family)